MNEFKLLFLIVLSCVTLRCYASLFGGDSNEDYGPSTSDYTSDENNDTDVENFIVNFMLFTRDHPNNFFLLQVNNKESIRKSNFDPSKETKFVIHGWHNGYNSNFSEEVRYAFLERYDANVINVDWSKQSHLNYLSSRMDVTKVANVVANMIDLLVNEFGMRSSMVHLVGHSLGAHVAGIAGLKLTTGNVSRITGLDPAMPMFTIYESGRLRSDSADFVDVIHSCGNLLGFKSALGQVDFYPNGGTFEQPGCGFDYKGKCSHSRSYMFYVESMKTNNFMAVKCNDWDSFVHSNCESTQIPMGEFTPRTARGNYYLTTNSESPFARGAVVYPDYPEDPDYDYPMT